MPTNSFNFTPYAADQAEIQRQQALAQALQAQSDPAPAGQMVGNQFVKTSPLLHLANALKGVSGSMWADQAKKQAMALQERQRGEISGDMSMLAQAINGRPAQTIQPDEQGMGMTPMEMPALSPVETLQQAIPGMRTPGGQQAAMGALQGAQTRADQQQFQSQQAAEARVARLQERAMQIEAAQQTAGANREMQERLARMADETRRELQASQQAFARQQAAEARANRPQPQAQVIQTDSGPMILPPGATQAVPITGAGGAAVRGPNAKGGKNEEAQRTLNTYVEARNGLLSGLEGTVTGPLLGRIPAFTSAQQTASGGVSAMAPVLKQLFRVAGEGTFTDKDQELLMEMLPTRADNKEARTAKIANIDRIIGAKLGMPVPPPPAFPKTPNAIDNPDLFNAADRIVNGG